MNRGHIFFPNLDGLRFFAFLGVFMLHKFHGMFSYYHHSVFKTSEWYSLTSKVVSAGHLGVNFFFVLSGFLITFLLLSEAKFNVKINIPHFYLRRILRIWPLYFFLVIFGFFIYPLIHEQTFGGQYNENTNLLYYLTFLGNFDVIQSGLPAQYPGLVALWTIAIEEQFYLLWPLILYVVSQKKLPHVFLIIIMISLGFRAYYHDNYYMISFHSLSVMSDLCIGGICAWLSMNKKRFVNFFATMSRRSILAVYVAGLMLCLFRNAIFITPLSAMLERVILALFFAFIILEQNYSENGLFKTGKWRIISFLGKISYGLYCFHILAIIIAFQFTCIIGIEDSMFVSLIGEPMIAMLITIALGMMSFYFIERPFLKVKKKFL